MALAGALNTTPKATVANSVAQILLLLNNRKPLADLNPITAFIYCGDFVGKYYHF
jgi:hypothetical protein